MDPFHISSSVVPSTRQLQDLKDHIRSMEEEKFHREEKFVSMKESILRRYMELEEEPETEFERSVWLQFLASINQKRNILWFEFYFHLLREIACEETEVFILSTANLERVKGVLAMLDNQFMENQRTALNSIEKIESLYERLKLDQAEKYQFLSMNQVREEIFIHF